MAIIQLFSKLFSNVKTIQRTIQYSKAGNFIQLKPKYYKESIRFEKNMVLSGDKNEETVIEGIFVIPKNVTVTIQDLTISPTARMYVEGDVEFQNCRFIGSKTDTIVTVDGGKINAYNCSFYDAKEIAIKLINCKAIFENCSFKKNGKVHISADCSQVSIEKSELTNAKHAFLIKNKSLLQSRNVHIHHQSNTQIIVEDAKYFDHDSMIEYGSGVGIQVSQSGEASLQSTILRYNTEAQIFGQNAYLYLRNCHIQLGKDFGVLIQNQSEAQISYCEIAQHKKNNLEISKQSRVNLEHCQIHSSESHGIYIAQDSIVNLYKVNVKSNRSSQILIIDHSICSMKKCAIKEGYHVGICVENKSNCAIVESEIMNNGNSAMTIFKSELTIYKSIISENVGNGIMAMSKSKLDVDTCKFFNNEMPHIACKSNVQIFLIQSELGKGKSLFIVNECELTAIDSQFYDSHNVQIEICDMSTARFEQCQIYDGRSYGIKVLRNSSCYFFDSQIFNHELAQMVVNDSSVILKNSEMFDGSKNALYIQNHSEVYIQDCFISKHRHHQLWVDFESTVELKSVQLTEGGNSDIYAQNHSSIYVSESIIRNHKSRYNVQAVNFSKIEITQTIVENKLGDVYYSANHSCIKQLDH